MLKFNNPKNLAFYSALFVAVFFLAIFIIVCVFNENPEYWWGFIVTPATFLFTYFLSKYILEKFIYEKIKPIYRTINRLQVKDSDNLNIPRVDDDIIEKVNKQVETWALNKSKEIEELKSMANYRREFLGNISHELKTPIFNIQGYVLTLLDGGLEDPNINKEYLMRTEKSVDRMIAIVKDLEDISKLEAGEVTLNKEPFDIRNLTKEVIEFMEIKARKKEMNISFGESNIEGAVHVFADKERIKQIMINLFDNAIKYRQSDIDGEIKISFLDMDENILIEITDNGIGIEEKDLPRLFERFYRTDKARSRQLGGSGLGLAIVKHIIEAHEQTINVRSSIGVGTTFGFTLQKVK